jgi:hypothetical protein
LFFANADLDHNLISYFTLADVTGMTDTLHHAQLFSFEMGLKAFFFLPEWPGNVNFLTSVSYLACNDKNITQHPSSG